MRFDFSTKIRTLPFARKRLSLPDVLMDKELAKLGDSYINFAYSLAESFRVGKASNSRVSTRVLAESLRRSGLRALLPRRTPTHDQADAVEALIFYAWLMEEFSLKDCILFLSEPAENDEVELFASLIGETVRRLRKSFDEPGTV